MVYCCTTGYYNPIYNLNNQGFFIAQLGGIIPYLKQPAKILIAAHVIYSFMI